MPVWWNVEKAPACVRAMLSLAERVVKVCKGIWRDCYIPSFLNVSSSTNITSRSLICGLPILTGHEDVVGTLSQSSPEDVIGQAALEV